MFLPHPCVERRFRPSPGMLIGAGSAPRLARREYSGALPSVLRAEHDSGFLQPRHQRALPSRPPELVLIERVPQLVVVAVGLPRDLCRVGRIAVDAAEPPRAVRQHVELGLAGRDPFGDRLTDPAGAAESVERESGRHEEARVPRASVRAAGSRRASSRPGWQTSLTISASAHEGEPPGRAVHQLLEPTHSREGANARRDPTARRRPIGRPDRARTRRTGSRPPLPSRTPGCRDRGSMACRGSSDPATAFSATW